MNVSTPPASEPIELAEAKAWLKVDWDDDSLIGLLISAAREKAEHYTNRAFISQGITESFPAGERAITLSRGKVISITSITIDGVALDPNDYIHLQENDGVKIVLNTAPAAAPVVVYTAGYGTDAESVPAAIKQALQLIITDWYENRGDGVKRLPTASTHLLNTQRRWVT